MGKLTDSWIKDFINELENRRYDGDADLKLKGIREVYAPIRAYVYLVHTLRAKLLRKVTDIYLDGPEYIIGNWQVQ